MGATAAIEFGPEVAATANFRRQHAELMQLGTEILERVHAPDVGARIVELRAMLARFNGRLRVHAAMEGEALYPRLLAHRDPAMRALAQQFVSELGGIYGAFDAYIAHWPDAASIAGALETFQRETRHVMKLLARRMMRETGELYPAIDEAERS